MRIGINGSSLIVLGSPVSAIRRTAPPVPTNPSRFLSNERKTSGPRRTKTSPTACSSSVPARTPGIEELRVAQADAIALAASGAAGAPA